MDITTFAHLFDYLTTIDDASIIEWLSSEERWNGKDKQESLLRLFAYLGLIDKFNNYDVCYGNFNNMTIKKLSNIGDILDICLNDSGDVSDLTFISKFNEKHLLLTTSKNINYMNVGKLDIEKITEAFNS